MFDEVCEVLLEKMKQTEWIELQELDNVVRRSVSNDDEALIIMEFLQKYFLDAKDVDKKVKIKFWAQKLMEIPV